MSAAKKKTARKRSGGIPFVALARSPGFERNSRMALRHPERLQPGLKDALERYLAEPLKAAAEDMQHLLDDRAQYRGGRTTGKDRKATATVRALIVELRAQHPMAKAKELQVYAKELRPLAIAKMLSKISPDRWANLVSEVAPRSRGRRG